MRPSFEQLAAARDAARGTVAEPWVAHHLRHALAEIDHLTAARDAWREYAGAVNHASWGWTAADTERLDAARAALAALGEEVP